MLAPNRRVSLRSGGLRRERRALWMPSKSRSSRWRAPGREEGRSIGCRIVADQQRARARALCPGARTCRCARSGPGDHPQLMTDVTFSSMGSDARLVFARAGPERAQAFLVAFERCLTRFDTASELSALNRSTRDAVRA